MQRELHRWQRVEQVASELHPYPFAESGSGVGGLSADDEDHLTVADFL